VTLRSDDSAPSVEASDDAGATTTRFAPVIAASEKPPFTPYHAKYLAYELTKRVGADQADKLAQSLSNATVDLNPHQVFIPSFILESKSYRELSRKMPSPFQQPNQVVICSYHFARAKAEDVTAVAWDLVVIDEAHRLRNVYKKDNKIARALRDAVRGRPKVLLTATPLQNSLIELYGLVTFVDEHVFGSEDAFRELYGKKSDTLTAGALANLRARLAPICPRTLRKQVIEYVRYTKRIPITEDFTPSRDEQRLCDQVSAYLQKGESWGHSTLASGDFRISTVAFGDLRQSITPNWTSNSAVSPGRPPGRP